MSGRLRRLGRVLGRALAIGAAGCLAILGIAYYFTVAPAPAVNVRWQEDVLPETRAELERRFLLVNPRGQEGSTIRYDLLDTTWENVRALARNPAVDDTSVIEQSDYTIPFDYPYGENWMWAAHRVPGLRTPGVIRAVVTLCGLIVVAFVLGTAATARQRKDAPSR